MLVVDLVELMDVRIDIECFDHAHERVVDPNSELLRGVPCEVGSKAVCEDGIVAVK